MTHSIEKTNSSLRKRTVYSASFLLPVLLFFLVCAFMKRWPFSSLTILDMDLPKQYMPYYSYLKSIFSGKNDLFYTFSKNLGGDMTGLLAYYLLSPLNFVFAFVPEIYFPMAATLLIAVKLGLCGLTMAIFLLYKRESGFSVLIFSTAYAFMAYTVLYASHLMWLDAVYTLPIVILGLEKLLERKKGFLYAISLSYALITNYYIGYMLCLFSVCYFAYRQVIKLAFKENRLLRDTGRFVLYSLLAGGMAAFVLLPTFFALSGSRGGIDTGKLEMFRIFDFTSFIYPLSPNAYYHSFGDFQDSGCLMFCGLASNALLILYMFNNSLKKRERIITVLFLFALVLSFNINGIYVMWHAFSYPNCFPYRNAFLLSFLIVYLGWQCFTNREGISGKNLLLAILFTVASVLILRPFSTTTIDDKVLIVEYLLLALCFVCIFLLRYVSVRRVALGVLAAIQLLSLLENAIYLKTSDIDYHRMDIKEYKDEYLASSADLERIASSDASFYRIGVSEAEINQPMQLAYNGLSHFSSTEKSSVKDFLQNYGYRFFEDSWCQYGQGATAANEALFSVKYLSSPYAEFKGYSKLFDGELYTVYENPNALGIGFAADDAVLSASLDEYNVFERQNQTYSALLGRDVELFTCPTDLKTETSNLLPPTDFEGSTLYRKEDESADGGFIFSFTAENDDPVYLYTRAKYPGFYNPELVGELYVNGEYLCEYMGAYTWETVCLGCFHEGEPIQVELRPQYDYFLMDDTFIYSENLRLLKDVCAELKDNADGELAKLSSSKLRWNGNVNSEDRVLFLSVPYEKGWSVTVDGKKAEAKTAFSVLTAIELPQGEHSVELTYTPPGLYVGIVISTLSFAAILILVFLKKKRSI